MTETAYSFFCVCARRMANKNGAKQKGKRRVGLAATMGTQAFVAARHI